MTARSPSTWGSDDRRWMRRALRLASLSLGHTAPNPGVGCVIVRDGQLLGEGRHKECGKDHGEVEALADVATRGNDPAGATVYVTLAPCTSQGRTPACSTALINAKVQRVVAAIPDPIQDDATAIFVTAGIVYDIGCEQELARAIHGGWLKRVQSAVPRCTGKWAMTLDGFIAPQNGGPLTISCSIARARSRRRRRAYDAIVVGAETVLADDPQLLATSGPCPARVVVSATARLPVDCRLIQTLDHAPLWLVHDYRAAEETLSELRTLGVETLAVDNAHDPLQVLRCLGTKGCSEVLVEGGAVLHGAFLAADAYDRLEIDMSALTIGAGMAVAQQPAQNRWQHEAPSIVRGKTQCMVLIREQLK